MDIVESGLASEITARTNADTTLQANITAEAAARVAADQTHTFDIGALDTRVTTNETDIADLETNLAQEVSDRIAGDNALSSALTTEATTRAAADVTLQNNIDAEEAARIAADDLLQTAIDNEAVARIAADGVLTTNVTNNTTAIATNTANLTTEIANRIAGDSALGGRLTTAESDIDALEGRMDTAEADVVSLEGRMDTAEADIVAVEGRLDGIDTDLAAETAARIAGDSATLASANTYTDTAITNLVDGADTALDTLKEIGDAFAAADSNLQTLITNNSTRLTAVEGEVDVLQSEMDAAEGRLTVNEGEIDTLQSDLTAETAARIAADTALQTALQAYADLAETDANTYADAEIAAAVAALEAADTALDGRVTTLEGEMDTAQADILTNAGDIVALDVRVTANEGDIATNASDITALDGRVTVNEGDIAQLELDLAAEVTRAQTAEAANATAIANEVTARQAAIDAEHQHHIDGDAATLTSANAYTDTRETAITAAYEAYADQAEVDAKAYTDAREVVITSAYEAADTLLNTAITNEASTRATADTNLQNTIDAEVTRAQAAEAANAAAAASNLLEITATQAAAGLNTDGTFNAYVDTNFIDTATTLRGADILLDAAIKSEETRALAAEGANATAISNEVTRATAVEAANAAAITAEASTRAAADVALGDNIQTVSDTLAQELLDRAAADSNLQSQIDFIVSNTDAAALDSLTEIVAAFQTADGDLLTTVTANTTAISTEEAARISADNALTTALGAEETARISGDATLQSNLDTEVAALEAADGVLQTNIDGKVAKSGDTMSGDLAMGGNKVTGLAQPSAGADAVNLDYLNTALSAYDLDNFTTTDLAEGDNLYYTDARVRAAVSASGDLSYDSETGVFSVDTSKALLDLTDYVGTETDYTAIEGYVLAVKSDGSGVELVDPASLSFAQSNRQTINGDGAQTTFALNFYATISNAMVFVGGVIQDPVTHYSLDSEAQTITFVEAIPTGTQAVVVANAVGNTPYIDNGSITSEKLASDVKTFIAGGNVTAGTSGSVVDTFSGATYRSAKFVIQVSYGSEYETREALVVHNGTSAFITEYAIVYTGAGLLGDASVQMNGTDVELVYTANNAGTTVKVIGTYIEA